jgi:hypothetical protein
VGGLEEQLVTQENYNVLCLKGELWESKWEVWKSSWLHKRTLEEPRETWANIAFAMGLSCQSLL